ncbi:serine O-acetyltransferase [Pleomorphomonas sp. PLEO]|uniref:serine O-acetyltransferase n=1 Tax=Pleomorphomonas sp. PLEO TaxID=3239306 RepID=UPI00351E8C36
MFGSMDEDWLADKARVPGRWAFFREQSLWAIWVYRFGQRVRKRRSGVVKRIKYIIYKILSTMVETSTGIRLPIECKIGKGLRIWHFGGIFVNINAVLGENCTLRQGVTIGNRYNDQVAPVIGDNVEIGAYAQVLGGITIGDNCKIGALTVVLDSMPEGSTAIGQRARIIVKKAEEQIA